MSASAANVWFWRQMATWSTLLKRDAMALEYRRRIADARPDDPRALASLAHGLAQSGGRPEAIALLERAVALDPANAGYGSVALYVVLIAAIIAGAGAGVIAISRGRRRARR